MRLSSWRAVRTRLGRRNPAEKVELNDLEGLSSLALDFLSGVEMAI